jgi:hypothetical protein
MRRSEGEDGGRRCFIGTFRIDAPLDGAVKDLMFYTWLKRVKAYFYCEGTGQALQRVCQKKRRTCVPHLRNVSNCCRFWVHQSVTGHKSCFPDTGVVTIVSTDFNLIRENLNGGVVKIGDKQEVMIISRGFEQIQLFDQMLGGYFRKKEISSMARKKRREPMIKCKHLSIASGATPIGNAVRVPDEIIKSMMSIFRVIQITLHILPSRGQDKNI